MAVLLIALEKHLRNESGQVWQNKRGSPGSTAAISCSAGFFVMLVDRQAISSSKLTRLAKGSCMPSEKALRAK
jgi:hypothetical protein